MLIKFATLCCVLLRECVLNGFAFIRIFEFHSNSAVWNVVDLIFNFTSERAETAEGVVEGKELCVPGACSASCAQAIRSAAETSFSDRIAQRERCVTISSYYRYNKLCVLHLAADSLYLLPSSCLPSSYLVFVYNVLTCS